MKIRLLILSLLLTFLIACGPPPQQPEGAAEEASHSADMDDEMVEESMEEEEMAEEEPMEEEMVEEEAADQPESLLNEATEIEFTLNEEGDGPNPVDGDYVQVHLVGSLEDGTVFANSYEIGEPIAFALNTPLMLPGINDAVAQMKVGDKASVVIPPALGFGSQPAGPIPPNSTLFVDIEFIGIADIEYEVIEEGTGAEVEVGDLVEVEYIGTLEDGTEFDNSYNRDQPFQLVVGAGQVIPGWEIGLLKMSEGGKAKFTIPPELAYGSTGAGQDIPPNATILFEVEIVSVTKQ